MGTHIRKCIKSTGGGHQHQTGQLLHASLSAQGAQWLGQTQGIASRVVAGDMAAAMSLLPESAHTLIAPLARQAFVGGFSMLLWVSGLLALLGALVVGTLMRNPIPAQPASQALVLE